jgi:hypothetical protein
MALDPVTAALDIGGKLIDKFFPDPTAKAEAQLKLLALQQSGELSAMMAQTDINKVEAANPSLFVSGWRPAVGWVCVFGLVYTFMAQPLLTWYANNHTLTAPPVLDLGTLVTLLGGMLGLSGLRTKEKIEGVASK